MAWYISTGIRHQHAAILNKYKALKLQLDLYSIKDIAGNTLIKQSVEGCLEKSTERIFTTSTNYIIYMLLGYIFINCNAIKDIAELHDISAKFTTKFNLKKLNFKKFFGSMLTYALNFTVCYTIIYE